MNRLRKLTFGIALVLSLAASGPAAADGTALITVNSPAPAGASDTRGDGVLRNDNDRPVTHNLLGKTLPEFELPKAGGGVFESTSLAGKWTVVTVWGVWCHDSRNDARNINTLGVFLAETPGIDFMSLHVPFNANTLDVLYRDHGSVEAYFEAENVSWPVALDETAAVRDLLQIQWTPTYLVIGPDLTVEAYRTDFSVDEDSALSDFLNDVQALKASRE